MLFLFTTKFININKLQTVRSPGICVMQPSKNIPRISISITNKPTYALDLQRGSRPASSLTPKIQISTARNNKITLNNSYTANKDEQRKLYYQQMDRSLQDRSALTTRNQNGSREPIEREKSISKLKNQTTANSKLVAMNKLKPCTKPNYLNKSKEDNCTLKIINQKLRELKLSQSIQPIVQPYRDRSSENYMHIPISRQSNLKYDTNKQMLASIGGIARSTMTEDASLSYPTDNSKNNPLYSNIPHLKLNLADQQTKQKKSPSGLIEQQPQNLQSSSQEFSFEFKKRQQMEKQIQMEKQLIQRREKQILIRQKQLQAQLSKQLERNKQMLKQKQNKKASLPFAQIRQKFYENETNALSLTNTPQHKLESEAQKCARITFIYEPFSLNLSSNHKSKELQSPPTGIPSAQGNLNKNLQDEEKKNSKKTVQLIKIEPQQFSDEDKWDKIVRERQKIYSKDSNLSPFVKHYYNQNQESNDFTNMKVKNYLISAASTDIKHAPESLYGINTRNDYFLNPSKELEQKQQSRTYSNSYVQSIQNEKSCQYSFVESGSPFTKQQMPQYQKLMHNREKEEEGEGEQDENITGLHEKIQMIASYYNKKKEQDMEIKKSQKQKIKDEGLSGRIKYSTPKIDPYIQKNLNLSLHENKMKNMQDMKYSYSFSEQKQMEYRQQKELFSKLLHCTHIQWMLYFTQMVNVVQNYGIEDRIGPEDGQDDSMLITYVKIGEDGQNIYENRIIAHYIGIWLLSMGYDDPEVKNRVISNVQLMFMDIDDIIAQDSSKKNSQQVSKQDSNVRNIVQLMFNNLLHGYLPTNLQVTALLEICRRGWQYFTFLLFRILKILINENRRKQKRISLNLEEFISDQELYKKLQRAISGII